MLGTRLGEYTNTRVLFALTMCLAAPPPYYRRSFTLTKNRIKEGLRNRFNGLGCRSYLQIIISALMMAIIALAVDKYPMTAPAVASSVAPKSEEKVASRRKKADEWLVIAETQLKMHRYQEANKSLEKCAALNGDLSKSQKKRMAR